MLLGVEQGKLSAALNGALDRGDLLAVADVLAKVGDMVAVDAGLASATIRMFALDDEVRVLRVALDRFEQSPMRQLHDLTADDPDLDLSDLFK